VTFDPFGDFEAQGYLRNLVKETARYEHQQLKRKRD
jgi:hypothetical protein